MTVKRGRGTNLPIINYSVSLRKGINRQLVKREEISNKMINDKTKSKIVMENKSKIPFTTVRYCIRRKSYIVRPYTFYLPIHKLYTTYTNKRTNPPHRVLYVIGITYSLCSHSPLRTLFIPQPRRRRESKHISTH